ncbi:MAG TPA: hypothetical protein VGZ00_05230 [Candidatus Baltobacteraceae bacterium]|jgi:hypothetical protein|nr:hypothetical protein [Candidatus Baltobacteraceae bacterium]
MIETLDSIDELQRLPSPAPAPQALAGDGATLWIGSRETKRIYGIDSHSGVVFEEAVAPGVPYGAVVTGDALRIVSAEGPDDDRFIRRYVIGHGFKNSELLTCPDNTGSYIGFDGESLYLSQFYVRRILQLDAKAAIVREIPVSAQIAGFVFVNSLIYVIRGDENTCNWRLARIDPRRPNEVPVDLAKIPFQARSLTFDGTRFWTNHREANTIVAFAKPD